MNTDTSNTDVWFELERLQQELSSRSSVLHFAHAGVSMLAALLIAGAAGKLYWDLPLKHLYLAVPVTVLSLGLAVYSLSRYLRGKRVLVDELKRFETLKSLRQSLQLDDPAALLPE